MTVKEYNDQGQQGLLLEAKTVAQLVVKFPVLSCFQQPTTRPYPETDESSEHLHNLNILRIIIFVRPSTLDLQTSCILQLVKLSS